MGNYNEFAKQYEQSTVALEERTRQNFYSLLPGLRGKSVLDVGCGGGIDATYYQSKGASVSGMDISEKQIALTRERVRGDFRVGQMNNLPYESNSFDVITSFYALQASDDVSGALKEMVRVVKPRGIVHVLTKHPIRNMIERSVNNGVNDYFAKGAVTSYIFDGKIKLSEPGHTLTDYLNPELLRLAQLVHFQERSDFAASAQLMGFTYPTYMIMQFKKL